MKRPLLLVIIIAVIALGGFWFTRMRKSGDAAAKTQYKIAAVETGIVKKSISSSGTLKPWSVVDIKSKAGGRVDQVNVEVGSVVTKDQVIARIDPADSVLNVSTAQADIDAANARVSQGDYQYQLQVKQSAIAITSAQAARQSAIASLNAAKARLATAKSQSTAQPSLTRAAIAQADANYNNAVKTRQQLDATLPQEKAQAQAAVNQAQANAKNAAESLRRQQELLKKGFVAQAAVDSADAAKAVADATLSSALVKLRTLPLEQQATIEATDARVGQAKAQLENAKAQSIDVVNRQNAVAEAQAAVAQAQAQVSTAEATLKQAIANQANNQVRRFDVISAKASTARAEAQRKNAQVTLDQTIVRSPVEGVILTKYVEPGTIITSGLSLNAQGTSIVQIGDVSKMYVDVTVDETDIANVDQDQKVDVTIEAYPGVPFEGKVARVDPQAIVEQNVTSVHVRVEIDNSSPTFRLLKPGMNATCEFVIDKKEDVVAVPSDAVRSDDQGQFVEVAVDNGKPAPPDPKTGAPADEGALIDLKTRRVPVEVGLEGNDSVEIKSGLKPGDKIVTQTIEPVTTAASASPFGGGGGRGMPGMGGGGRR